MIFKTRQVNTENQLIIVSIKLIILINELLVLGLVRGSSAVATILCIQLVRIS